VYVINNGRQVMGGTTLELIVRSERGGGIWHAKAICLTKKVADKKSTEESMT